MRLEAPRRIAAAGRVAHRWAIELVNDLVTVVKDRVATRFAEISWEPGRARAAIVRDGVAMVVAWSSELLW